MKRILIGTAGWSISSGHALSFAGPGTHLNHYARVMGCTEINSSFYRPHRASTYSRWADSTPEDFRFSVKAPRSITHERKLKPAADLLRAFSRQIAYLNQKLGPILFQLPPKQMFGKKSAEDFLRSIRDVFPEHSIVLEPRHASWFEHESMDLLCQFRIGRVGADPAKLSAAAIPAGDPSIQYYRLHGSPRMYYSSYDDNFLEALCSRIAGTKTCHTAWVIFDNTASGAAIADAIRFDSLLDKCT